MVNFVLRARANNHGKNPSWNSYEKLRSVIEKKMFSNTEDLLPVISFNAKAPKMKRKNMRNLFIAWLKKAIHANKYDCFANGTCEYVKVINN